MPSSATLQSQNDVHLRGLHIAQATLLCPTGQHSSRCVQAYALRSAADVSLFCVSHWYFSHKSRACSASLQGADNVLLDGVFHSMGKIGAREVSSRPWYGSEEVIDAWAAHLL